MSFRCIRCENLKRYTIGSRVQWCLVWYPDYIEFKYFFLEMTRGAFSSMKNLELGVWKSCSSWGQILTSATVTFTWPCGSYLVLTVYADRVLVVLSPGEALEDIRHVPNYPCRVLYMTRQGELRNMAHGACMSENLLLSQTQFKSGLWFVWLTRTQTYGQCILLLRMTVIFST